jgi:uncharacterized protein YjbI with pentapeptide repeats
MWTNVDVSGCDFSGSCLDGAVISGTFVGTSFGSFNKRNFCLSGFFENVTFGSMECVKLCGKFVRCTFAKSDVRIGGNSEFSNCLALETVFASVDSSMRYLSSNFSSFESCSFAHLTLSNVSSSFVSCTAKSV